MDLSALLDYVAVSETTAYKWIMSRADPLPASRVDGKLFIRRMDVDDWLLKYRVSRDTPDLDGLVDDIVKDILAS